MALVFWPLDRKYRAWRDDPNRDRVYRPNWRGRYVPDLWLGRARRLLIVMAVAFAIFGFAVLFTIEGFFPPPGVTRVLVPPPVNSH